MKHLIKVKRIEKNLPGMNNDTEEILYKRLEESWPEAELFGYRNGTVYLAPEGTIVFDCPPSSSSHSHGNFTTLWERPDTFSASLRLFTLREDIPIDFFDSILEGIAR